VAHKVTNPPFFKLCYFTVSWNKSTSRCKQVLL